MRRASRRSSTPYVRPVEKVSLSEKNLRWRLAGVICLVMLAAGAFAYGIFQWLQTDPGWKDIEADPSADINCAADFIFQYNLGADGGSPAAQQKQLQALYTDSTVKAYRLFSNDQNYDGYTNVYDINQHPNEELEIDSALYKALEAAVQDKERHIYLAPVYRIYDNIFYCTEDYQLGDFDPRQNEEIAGEISELLAYTNDSGDVELEMLGDNRICLRVSDEYLEYSMNTAGELNFIDFYWMKNAFITDYIADTIAEAGFTHGSVSSFDGFARNLDSSKEAYGLNVFARQENTVYTAAQIEYTGPLSIVSFRDYPMSSRDSVHYYEMENSRIITPFIDNIDGLDKSSIHSMILLSDRKSCGEIAVEASSVFIADKFEAGAVEKMKEQGISTVYCKDKEVISNAETVVISNVREEQQKGTE